MSRRDQNRTDETVESTYSITESIKNLVIGNWQATSMYLFSDDELRKAQPEYILNRMLSTKSYISTNSSLAEENQRARDDASHKTFIEIGQGQCGTMYALKGTTKVIKLPNSTEKEDELFRDARMHETVKQAFQSVHSALRIDINVPGFRCWVSPTTQPFWDEHGPQFHRDVKVPNYGLMSDRIYPLPFPVREAIVDALCPKSIKSQKTEFLRRAENKDCLVRLYLGRRDVDREKMDVKNIRLRNFPLHADEMERLKLDTAAYTKVMAQALAIMHWQAGVDANDVEFVLGSAPQVTEGPLVQELEEADKDSAAALFQIDFKRRSVGIWLLDFNQCHKFGDNPEGLKQLVNGFWWNDPYYPRPNSTNANDKALWKIFSQRYLDSSAELTTSETPQRFITALETEGKKRSTGGLFG